ncbi:hypothetical protein BDV93DRAFT_483165 [Ceratobasidium sp. AG-I]|nr:hypothetical protein BDV93DRAFT_483165 [Ceratobasidium sp. AG-I]
MRPSHHTKHLPHLTVSTRTHTFHIAQADDGASNGTALWLSGQVLSAFLAALPAPRSSPPRAIELGSGVGLTALVLASLGWDVIATDAHPSVLSLLNQNVRLNSPNLSGTVHVRELDWTVPPDHWDWSHPTSISGPHSDIPPASPTAPTFDLILTADTLYTPNLTPHLLRTLQHLACPPIVENGTRMGTPIPTYIALERRDPSLIDQALSHLPHATRIPQRKLSKAMQSIGWTGWDPSDWSDVEIWKVRWAERERRSRDRNLEGQTSGA